MARWPDFAAAKKSRFQATTVYRLMIIDVQDISQKGLKVRSSQLGEWVGRQQIGEAMAAPFEAPGKIGLRS